MMKGCYFYFQQAVLKKVIQYGLKDDYDHKSNAGLRCSIKWLMSLVLLPPDVIISTFLHMYDKVKGKKLPKLKKLYKDYQKTWINGNNWSINEICQWDQHVRTNDDAERFHLRLKNIAFNTPFYNLINILGDIATSTQDDANMFAQELIDSYQKKTAISFKETLAKASEALENKEINGIQFLNSITQTNHDNQIVNEEWGKNFSRIDVWPESEIEENESEENESESESGYDDTSNSKCGSDDENNSECGSDDTVSKDNDSEDNDSDY